jgi:outer membrane protein assembly factor BamB
MTIGARRTGLLRLAILALCGAALLPAVAHASSIDQATAYQLDPAHDGYQTGSSITTPLTQAWSVTLGGNISYPLVVNGVIYVTAGDGAGTTLYAIEQASGATLWSHTLGGSYGWSGLTYDAGQVFTVDYNGTMTAFDAETGLTDWSITLPGQYSFSSPPTAYNGIVYVGGAGSGGTVYAVSEGTGAVRWTQSVENGDHSSPAVDSNGVYVTYACGQDYDFSPLSGALIWHHSSSCEGGGGTTPVLANGTIFGRDSSDGDLILSAGAGTQVGSFSSTTAPAVGGGSAYTLAGGTLTEVSDSGQGSNQWSYSGISGDGTLDTAPLFADGLLIEGSTTGELYALNPATGGLDWSGTVGVAIAAPDEQNVGSPLTGLGAGENTIIVPAGSALAAYTGAGVGTGTPASTLAPSVSGTPEAGQAVGADVGLWSALPTSYTYQWYLCDGSGGACQEISGATAEAYVPPTPDVGDTLKVAVTATNGSGTATAVTSAASAPIIPPPPALVTAPAITGTAAAGQQLTASSGTWTGNPTSFRYQWLECSSTNVCAAISGATSSTYDVTSAQGGDTLEVQVVASNSSGPSLIATSVATATVSVATRLTLTSSANPTAAGDTVVFTATLSGAVDGGSMWFDENGQLMPGCTGITLDWQDIGVTCTVPGGLGGGTWTITAYYGGDATFLSSSASLTEIVSAATAGGTGNTANPTPTASAASAPPIREVGAAGPKGKPNLNLMLTAVRTSTTPYRYWFAVTNVRCMNRASAIAITGGAGRLDDKCGAKIELASKSLAVHQHYDVTLQAIRYGRKHKVVARGRAYHEKLYMPGSEVQWTPITGISVPITGHSAKLVRGPRWVTAAGPLHALAQLVSAVK